VGYQALLFTGKHRDLSLQQGVSVLAIVFAIPGNGDVCAVPAGAVLRAFAASREIQHSPVSPKARSHKKKSGLFQPRCTGAIWPFGANR
jgi:hypothetical protein